MTTLGDVIAAFRASLERLPFTELADALNACRGGSQPRRERDLVSGEHDWQQARDVLTELGIGPARGTLWAASHVEVKLAAALHGLAARSVTLAVNNAPCDTGRWSYDRLLPRILKPGQTVAVHWPGGKQTYRGKEARG